METIEFAARHLSLHSTLQVYNGSFVKLHYAIFKISSPDLIDIISSQNVEKYAWCYLYT